MLNGWAIETLEFIIPYCPLFNADECVLIPRSANKRTRSTKKRLCNPVHCLRKIC